MPQFTDEFKGISVLMLLKKIELQPASTLTLTDRSQSSMNRSSHQVLAQRDIAAPNGSLPGAPLQAEIHCSSLRACARGLRLSMSEASLAPASPGHSDLYPSLVKTVPNNPGQ